MLAINKQWETLNYKWTINNLTARYRANRERYNVLREAAQTLTFKEAMNSSDWAGFQPDLFTSDLIEIGSNENITDRIFGVETQTQQNDFKVRYRKRSDGVQVLREGDEFKQSKSSRSTTEWRHLKYGDFPVKTWEAIEDALINEIQSEMNLSISKMYRLYNQLMAHQLTLMSQGANATTWDNFRDISAPYTELEEIDAGIQASYINLTTRLRDRIAPASLQILWSPNVFSLFFKDADRRRYDILGTSPTQVTGRAPSPYGMTATVWESGYFTTDMKWMPTTDVFVFNPICATNRERVSLRIEPFNEIRNQTTGPLMWGRRSPYVRMPFMYERISGWDTYSDILPDLSDLVLEPGTESAIASPDDHL